MRGWEQGTENRGQRTGDREQGTENRGQRTGDREQGIGIRDQVTEDREQRTGSRGAVRFFEKVLPKRDFFQNALVFCARLRYNIISIF